MAPSAQDPGPPGLTRRRALVSGQVQGVFFRDHCVRRAQVLGLAGFVRNRSDGRVEIVAEGSAAAVDDLLAWARQGPPRAEVHRVDVVDEAPTGEAGFTVSW